MAGADRLNGRRELFRRNPSDAKALGLRAEQPSDNAALHLSAVATSTHRFARWDQSGDPIREVSFEFR